MVAAGGADRYQIAARMKRLPLLRRHNKPLSSVLSPYLVGNAYSRARCNDLSPI
jgi:hypothetical protein